MNEELLKAISDMLDEKLKPINERLNNMDNRLEIIEIKEKMTHSKLNDLSLDLKNVERNISKDIAKLNDETETLIAVLEARGILPKAL